NASIAVGRRLASRIVESGDPRGTVDAEVCPVNGDQRFAHIAQRRFAWGSDALFDQHDPCSPLTVQLADGVGPNGVGAESPFRLVGALDLGNQPAHRRIPSGKLDPGCFADQTASSIAADEILRAQASATR